MRKGGMNMQLLDPPYYYHNMVKGAKYYVRADRQKFINWKAIYVDPRPQRRGAAEIAPLLNFRNSGNPYAAPNVEFRGFVGRGRTVFMVFRDVWGDITMIPNNMILTLRRMIQPITNVIAQHFQQLQIQHTED